MKRALLTLLLLMLVQVSAFGQVSAVPQLMNFQGRLAKPDGTPVAEGTYTLTFRLYDQQLGGTVKWAEQIGSVVVRNGVFSCVLGNILPFNDTHLNGTVWLEIQVNTDSPLIPRQRLQAVAYALKANTVPDGAITTAKIADGAITQAKLAPGVGGGNPSGAAGGDLSGTYPNPLVALGVITTEKITDNAVTAAKIANNAVDSTKLLVDAASLLKVSGGALSSAGGNIAVNGGLAVTTNLDVQGSVRINGQGSGLRFSDGTIQTTAAPVGGSGVPSGYSILGLSATPPAGFVFTNSVVLAGNRWEGRSIAPTRRFGIMPASDGQKIYVVGGNFGGTDIETNEEYDPTTDTWTIKAPMPTPQLYGGAVFVRGKLYIFGGNRSPSLVQEYDPSNNSWSTKAPMPAPLERAGVAVVNDKIYVIGGWRPGGPVATVEEYDPQTNRWRTAASMITAVYNMACVALGGHIHVIGGNTDHGISNLHEVYDATTNTWSSRQPLPLATQSLSGVEVGGKIYVIGGQDGLNWVYDPQTDKWTAHSSLPGGFPVGESGRCMNVNGLIHFIGGSPASTGSLHFVYVPPVTYYLHTKQ